MISGIGAGAKTQLLQVLMAESFIGCQSGGQKKKSKELQREQNAEEEEEEEVLKEF